MQNNTPADYSKYEIEMLKGPTSAQVADDVLRVRSQMTYTDPKTNKFKKKSMLTSNVFFYRLNSKQENVGWEEAKSELKTKCQTEDWGQDSIILHNYLTQLFDAVAKRYLSELKESGEEHDEDYETGLFFTDDDKYMLFNTSLYNSHFEQIYMLCTRNRIKQQQLWFFKCWCTNQELAAMNLFPRKKPISFIFFREHHELYFTPTIELTIFQNHIMQDDIKHNRIPTALSGMRFQDKEKSDYAEKLASAVARMLVRVKQNSRTVVPQYFDGKLQLLLPLSFSEDNAVQLVIPVSKEQKDLKRGETVRDPNNPDHWHYVGRTVLDMKMAYNNARLLNRLESEWLRPHSDAELIAACPVCNPLVVTGSGTKSITADLEDDDTVSAFSDMSSLVNSLHSASTGNRSSPIPKTPSKATKPTTTQQKCTVINKPRLDSKTFATLDRLCKFGVRCTNGKCQYKHE